jgi:hypothetical protein
MADTKGLTHAAARFYRLADIAAGAYVLPDLVAIKGAAVSSRDADETIAALRRECSHARLSAKMWRNAFFGMAAAFILTKLIDIAASAGWLS